MKRRIQLLAIVLLAGSICSGTVQSQTNYGALGNGNWNNAATWTPVGGPPLAVDNAYIGSNFPPGSAPGPVTVSLTADQIIAYLGMGHNAGTNGTLDLGANKLTATTIEIGLLGGIGAFVHGGGHFETTDFNVYNGNSYMYDSLDRATNLAVRSAATVTTANILNATTSVTVFDQNSQLNLGANLFLTADLDIRGTGATPGTVDANGFNITARDIFIGRFNTAGAIVDDGAIVATGDLYVEQNAFTLDANDTVANTVGAGNLGTLTLDASTAAMNARVYGGGTLNTAATGNLNTGVLITDSGSQINLGANLILSADLDIRGTGATPGTVDANGFNITARDIFIGRFNTAGTIVDDGAIVATGDLFVEQLAFTLDANDTVANTVGAGNLGTLTLDASTAAMNARVFAGGTLNSAATGNLNTGVLITESGSQMNLGANLVLAADLDIRGTGATPGTVDANGFNITARDIFLGRFNTAGTIVDDGAIVATRDLFVEQLAFTLDANDTVANTVGAGNLGTLTLDASTAAMNARVFAGGTLNSAATGNLNTGVLITESGSQMNLGANLVLAADLDIRGTGATPGTVDANGFNITARDIFLGRFNTAGTIVDDGAIVATGDLFVEQLAFTLDANDTVANTVGAGNLGTLTLDASTAAMNGRVYEGGTLNTAATGNLNTGVLITDSGSQMNAGANMVLTGDVDIRGTGNNVATLDLMGNDLTADSLFVGRFNNSGALLNDGQIIVNNLTIDPSTLILHGGNDIVNTLFFIDDGSLLRVQQAPNELAGLTFNGNTLSFMGAGTGVLDLQFDNSFAPGLDWAFRWAGNRVAAINAFIGAGQIIVSAPQAFSVFDNGDGYTYVGFEAVPEPTSAILIGVIGLGCISRRRRSKLR